MSQLTGLLRQITEKFSHQNGLIHKMQLENARQTANVGHDDGKSTSTGGLLSTVISVTTLTGPFHSMFTMKVTPWLGSYGGSWGVMF